MTRTYIKLHLGENTSVSKSANRMPGDTRTTPGGMYLEAITIVEAISKTSTRISAGNHEGKGQKNFAIINKPLPEVEAMLIEAAEQQPTSLDWRKLCTSATKYELTRAGKPAADTAPKPGM